MADLDTIIANPRTSLSEIKRLLPIVARSDLAMSRKTLLINLVLQDSRRAVRCFAAVMAGHMGDASTIPFLERMVAAEEFDALVSLARLTGTQLTPRLVEMLKSPDPMRRMSAIPAAKRLPGEAGVKLLADALAVESLPHVRLQLAICLAYKGRRDGFDLLKPLIEDESHGYHTAVVCSLCGLADENALQKLKTLLARPSVLAEFTCSELYWALAEGLQLGHGAPEDVFATAREWVEGKLRHSGE